MHKNAIGLAKACLLSAKVLIFWHFEPQIPTFLWLKWGGRAVFGA